MDRDPSPCGRRGHRCRERQTIVRLVGFGAVVLLAGSAASAAAAPVTVTHHCTQELRATDWQASCAVPAWRPEDGQLTAVRVFLEADARHDVGIENRDSSARTITTTLVVDVSVEGPGELRLSAQPTLSRTDALAVYDGAADFAGTSGKTFRDLGSADTTERILSADAELAAFRAAAGSVPLTVRAAAGSTIASGGNADLRTTTSAAAAVAVTYSGRTVDATLRKSAEGPFRAGREGTYVFTVGNAGDEDLPGPTVVTDALPDGLTFVRASDGEGWICQGERTLECTREAGIAQGNSSTFKIVVALARELSGPLRNTARVTTPAGDARPADNTASADVTVQPRGRVQSSAAVARTPRPRRGSASLIRGTTRAREAATTPAPTCADAPPEEPAEIYRVDVSDQAAYVHLRVPVELPEAAELDLGACEDGQPARRGVLTGENVAGLVRYVFAGLAPDTPACVRVRLRRGCAAGAWSPALQVRTGPAGSGGSCTKYYRTGDTSVVREVLFTSCADLNRVAADRQGALPPLGDGDAGGGVAAGAVRAAQTTRAARWSWPFWWWWMVLGFWGILLAVVVGRRRRKRQTESPRSVP